jgi:arylsulfatase A-like enzyme
MARRPNIIFITADQHRGDCLGVEGRRVHTPHLDLMAKHGTRFQACITPNPVCQPARASLLTGLLPRTHGVSDNGIDLPPKLGEAGFAGSLGRAGYRTALIGKPHFATSHTFEPTGTPECRSSMDRFGPDWHGPYMGFEHVELVIEGHNCHLPMEPPFGQHYEHWYFSDGLGQLKTDLYLKNAGPDTAGAPQTWHSALPTAWHNSTWVGDRTIAYMNDHKDEPFCVWASFPDPHHPFDCPIPWSLLHALDDVDLPPHWELDLDRRPWWHRASLEGKPQIRGDMAEFREKFSRTPPLNEIQLRNVIANYYGMISLIDHNVGRIIAELSRLGLLENTIVVYTSDHGDWLGDHGLLLKGPMHYEGLLRVPCLVQGPGVPRGQVIEDPVSTLDLPATFLDYGEAQPLGPMHSRSLRPLIEGRGERREFAYCEWDLRPSRTGVELQLRTVRTRTHKLTLDLASGAGELYDLEADPNEMANRFDDAAYAMVRKNLTRMIHSRPEDAVSALPQVGMA